MKSVFLWVCCALLISGVQPLSAQRPPVEAPVPQRFDHRPSNDDYPGRPATGWPNVLLFLPYPSFDQPARCWRSLYDPFMNRPAEGWLKIRYTRELLPVLEIVKIQTEEILPLAGNLYRVQSISRKNGMQMERVGFAAPPGEQPGPVQAQKPSLTAIPTRGHLYLHPEEFGYPGLQGHELNPPSGRYWDFFSFAVSNQVRPIPRIIVNEILPAADNEKQPRVKLTIYDRRAGAKEMPEIFTVGDVLPIGKQGGGLKITRIQPPISDLWVWGQSENSLLRKFQANLRGWVEFEIVKSEAEE